MPPVVGFLLLTEEIMVLLLPEEVDDEADGMIGVIDTDGLMSAPKPLEATCSFFSVWKKGKLYFRGQRSFRTPAERLPGEKNQWKGL